MSGLPDESRPKLPKAIVPSLLLGNPDAGSKSDSKLSADTLSPRSLMLRTPDLGQVYSDTDLKIN